MRPKQVSDRVGRRGGMTLTLVAVLLAVQVAYLLTFVVAAAIRRRRLPSLGGSKPLLRFVVLVPAHDEAEGIGATLASLAAVDLHSDAMQVIVIADNCRDATAAIARRAGVRVLERRDRVARGKGHAIAWALERLTGMGTVFDVLVVVDADCTVSPNLLQAIGAHVRDGAEAVQVRYEVANPAASRAAGLRYAGYALMNTLRPMGRTALGLSAGLTGSGMAFTQGLLHRLPWTAASIVEDHEHHLALVEAGSAVTFAPEAWVRSPMPTSLRNTGDQQLRWEAGRLRLAGGWASRLLREGLRRRDPQRLNAGLELLIPPQSLLLAGNLAVSLVATVRGRDAARRLATAGLTGQAIYVLSGLAVAGAPGVVYRSLVAAPVLVGHKLVLALRIARGRGPREFVRTQREEQS